MPDFPHLAQRMFNTPIAILPAKAEVVVAALADRMGIAHLFRADGQMIPLDLDDAPQVRGPAPQHGYDLVAGRIAVIQIRGTTVQRSGSLRPMSGMTGYDGIRQNLLAALADDQVEAILFDVDSPGGEVAGCFDLVDTIKRARGYKPIWSALAENAFSAAFGLVCPSDVITVPRTGGTGSVGVIYMHTDMSKALTGQGIKITLVTDGDLKSDGNEFEPLSQRAFDKLQADVSRVAVLFRETVADNRRMSVKAVRDTQAGTFLGEEGVRIGFADAVMAPDEAIQALLAELR